MGVLTQQLLSFGGFSTSSPCRPVRAFSFALVALVLACLSIAVATAGADELPAPAGPAPLGQSPPGGTGEPPPTPPEPPQQPAPGGDQSSPPGDPPPPPQGSPPGDTNPSPGSQSAPADDPGSDSWTVSPDRPSDTGTQQGAASPAGSAGSTSGAALSGGDSGTSGPGNSGDSAAIPPGVDNFDSFTGTTSGGTGVLDGPSTCAAAACGTGAGDLVASVAASAKRLQERAALERDTSRVAGLEKAMPPSTPGGIPGRAFSMPGSGGGGGAAFVLIGLVAILGAALAHGNWTTSFRLPTATWRLSAYVPPIESPG